MAIRYEAGDGSVPGRIVLEIGWGSDLVQVGQFGGRYFVRNGYNRLYALRSLGHELAPALLVNCTQPEHALLGAPGFFAINVAFGARPPRMRHFFGPAGCEIRMPDVVRVLRFRCDSFVLPRMGDTTMMPHCE